MDCRIIDSKGVVRDGSLVSVAQNHFGQADISDCYFGRVLRVVHDEVNKSIGLKMMLFQLNC